MFRVGMRVQWNGDTEQDERGTIVTAEDESFGVLWDDGLFTFEDMEQDVPPLVKIISLALIP